MALPRAIRTLLEAVRVVKGFPWWLLSPPTKSKRTVMLDFGTRTFFALAPALGAHCSCVHALRCARACMNLRSIRAVLLLCTFTGCISDHKLFLQHAFPLFWESPTLCSSAPRHSACAKWHSGLCDHNQRIECAVARFAHATSSPLAQFDSPLFHELTKVAMEAGKAGHALFNSALAEATLIPTALRDRSYIVLPTREQLGSQILDDHRHRHADEIKELSSGLDGIDVCGFSCAMGGSERYGQRACIGVAFILPNSRCAFWRLDDLSGVSKNVAWVRDHTIKMLKDPNLPFNYMQCMCINVDGANRAAFEDMMKVFIERSVATPALAHTHNFWHPRARAHAHFFVSGCRAHVSHACSFHVRLVNRPDLPNAVPHWCSGHSVGLLMKTTDDISGITELIAQTRDFVTFARTHSKPSALIRKKSPNVKMWALTRVSAPCSWSWIGSTSCARLCGVWCCPTSGPRTCGASPTRPSAPRPRLLKLLL